MTDVDVVRDGSTTCMASRDLDRLVQLIDEGCVITQDPVLPWGGRFEGHDGFATFALTLTGTHHLGGDHRGAVRLRPAT